MNDAEKRKARSRFREIYGIKVTTNSAISKAIEKEGYREVAAFNAKNFRIAKWNREKTISFGASEDYTRDEMIQFLVNLTDGNNDIG